MKIIIFGIGQGLDYVEEQLSRECEIIGYMDSYSKISIFKGKKFYPIEAIKMIHFDFLVITILNRKASWEVYNSLKKDYGIDGEKIIPFYVFERSELHYRRYGKNKNDEIEGIILGNSHARFGYISDYMSRRFVNLACPSQDMYCNYKILLECKKNLHKFRKIKYIVIDLYDYNFFNIDVSMGKGFIDYISWGGVIEEHNFKNNTNYERSFANEIFEQTYILTDKTFCQKTMQKVFRENGCLDEDKIENNRWLHIDEQASVPMNVIGGGNVLTRHEKTIKENIILLEEIVNEIKEISKEIKIIFTLIPRYKTVESVMDTMLLEWKREFMEIVKKFQIKYNVYFWNFKENKQIFDNANFYYDTCHLNTIGGRCLTAILENKVNETEGGEANG